MKQHERVHRTSLRRVGQNVCILRLSKRVLFKAWVGVCSSAARSARGCPDCLLRLQMLWQISSFVHIKEACPCYDSDLSQHMENGANACLHMKIQKYPLRRIRNKTSSPCLDGARFEMKNLLLFNVLKNVLGLHRVCHTVDYWPATRSWASSAFFVQTQAHFKGATEDILHF